MSNKTAIVIGAGIAGLAMTRSLCMKGYSVTVLERSGCATGASVRNFGMIWPIGQPDSEFPIALRSRDIWRSLGEANVFWYKNAGSLHLAYQPEELNVLKELAEKFGRERFVRLLKPDQVTEHSPAVIRRGLLGALFSPHELIVDPREAIANLPGYLHEKWNVDFQWSTPVVEAGSSFVVTAMGTRYEADLVVVCSGPDLENLFASLFAGLPIEKCKLQMMRFASQSDWHIGPSLCGGLSLIHYKSFEIAESVAELKKHYLHQYPEQLRYGIHVMVSQNGKGELTVGDSHEYGGTHDPFDRQEINDLVLDYLDTFAKFRNPTIIQTWNGIYPKLMNGDPYLFVSPQPGVYIFNGLGGHGMTMSFGFAEMLADTL